MLLRMANWFEPPSSQGSLISILNRRDTSYPPIAPPSTSARVRVWPCQVVATRQPVVAFDALPLTLDQGEQVIGVDAVNDARSWVCALAFMVHLLDKRGLFSFGKSHCRRTGQSFWTRCNGKANQRQDLDDRAKNIDARAGRQQVARGKVRPRAGRDRSTSSALCSQTLHGFRRPGVPPNLRRSVHAQWLTGSGKRNSVRCR
jgi:hypothetical protein